MQLSEPADSESQLPGADSIYLRLSQLLERQRQELGRFRAGLDGSVAQVECRCRSRMRHS